MTSVSTLKSNILRNLGANAYGQLITVVIQLMSVPMFLHYWGVAIYGEWMILSAIPAYLALSDIGFASVAANDMTMRVANGDKQGTQEVYQSIWVFICAVSTIVGVVLALSIHVLPLNALFSINNISIDHTRKLLIVLMLYVLVGLQGGVLNAAFRAVGRYAYSTMMNNTIRFTEWLLSMAALVLGGSVFSVAVVMFSVRIAGLFIMWALLRKKAPWLSLGIKTASVKKINELLKPAVAFMAFPLGLALSLQGMVLVIGVSLGSTAVVIFSAYRTLTRLLVQVITMINQAIWPEISAAYGAGKMELVVQLHRKGSFITFWIALAAVTTLGFFGEWIIDFWTNNVFAPNIILLILLLTTSFLNVLWQTSWVLLMATNKHEIISILFLISNACSLLFSAMAIDRFGLNGVGLVLILAELPLIYFVINSALVLLSDTWKDYVQAIFRNSVH